MSTAVLKLPSTQDIAQAQKAVRELSTVALKRQAKGVRIQPEGSSNSVSVLVPRVAFDLFLEVLGQMANGNAVTIVPVQAELTTQQAADLMNVSRPYLIGLLDQGKIAYRRVGAHRRIKFADLMQFKQTDDVERQAVLDALTEDAQQDGLGY